MRKSSIAFAAAVALPLHGPSFAQAPAQIDIEAVDPISGNWSYRAIPGGSEADYIDARATVRLMVRCNRAARTVSIVRTGVPAAAPTLSIWTTSMARSVPSSFLATKQLVATVAATDSLLDAIAFSRGRFATGASGAPLVAVRSGPETTRVIEDCRS
ncbi:MAG TPA: hypothetical protein VFI88_04895 [Sphingomicrobium sp.]|jgi:hypothetical protein|nr:hypothetical protein [Sphingomicrobium sp.]